MAIGSTLGPVALRDFPALTDSNHIITSKHDKKYNCIAWAANRFDKWWWPPSSDDEDFSDDNYWPDGIPGEETVETFTLAYGTIGFVPCSHGMPEVGYEKVVIYALQNPSTQEVVVKHAARLKRNGRWTSKLGGSVDIEHDLDALNGPCYGNPVRFLKRSIVIAALFDHNCFLE